eukprot:249306_1
MASVSVYVVAIFLVSAFAEEKRNFSPQPPSKLSFNQDRIWIHLNPKCFSTQSSVHDFKTHLLNEYPCISYNEQRKTIYKHPLSANYSVWSLWFEKRTNFDCLNTTIDLPPTVLSACVDNIFYEPLQSLTAGADSCGVQGTKQGLDLWSLDILDGKFDDVYIYPEWDTTDDTVSGTSVEAIILDTMVDADHVEFEGLDTANLFTGTLNPDTSYLHGTHVAGTVVGHDVGGAKNTKLRYYPVCQSNSGCAWSDIEGGYNTAIEYMKSGDGKTRYVINYSVGGRRDVLTSRAYIAWGKQINKAGGIWVTSAGNSDADACEFSPAFTEQALTVGAYDVNTQAAWFSNYGECVDTWGPGVLVESASPGGGYEPLSGTSMSSPNIAAMVVNLLKENGELDLDDIKEYMNKNARFVDNDGKEGIMNQAYLTCAQ